MIGARHCLYIGHLSFLAKMPEFLESNAEAHQGKLRASALPNRERHQRSQYQVDALVAKA